MCYRMTELVKNKKLTSKQELFCQYVISGLSQHDAYLKAGYSSNMLPDTIDNNAYMLTCKSEIKARILELKQLALTSLIMSVSERKEILSELGRAKLTDFVGDNGEIKLKPSAALAELVIEDWQGSGDDKPISRNKRIKLRDPIAAIAELNKMERIGTPDTAPGVINNNVQVIIVSGMPRPAYTQNSENIIDQPINDALQSINTGDNVQG
jgi:phage terminase small subunit